MCPITAAKTVQRIKIEKIDNYNILRNKAKNMNKYLWGEKQDIYILLTVEFTSTIFILKYKSVFIAPGGKMSSC